jgi:hypothetical protein
MALTLKNVEAELKSIVEQLNQQLSQPNLQPDDRQTIQNDIQNVQAIIDGLPSGCHKTPAYDLGI